jgi:hypothetical protein
MEGACFLKYVSTMPIYRHCYRFSTFNGHQYKTNEDVPVLTHPHLLLSHHDFLSVDDVESSHGLTT